MKYACFALLPYSILQYLIVSDSILRYLIDSYRFL